MSLETLHILEFCESRNLISLRLVKASFTNHNKNMIRMLSGAGT